MHKSSVGGPMKAMMFGLFVSCLSLSSSCVFVEGKSKSVFPSKAKHPKEDVAGFRLSPAATKATQKNLLLKEKKLQQLMEKDPVKFRRLGYGDSSFSSSRFGERRRLQQIIVDGPENFDDCNDDQYRLLVELKTDRYPQETTWEITDSETGDLVDTWLDSEDVTEFEAERDYHIRRCLDNDRDYIFTVYDSWGDGLCCDASFRVIVDGTPFEPSNEFTYSQHVSIPQLKLVDADGIARDVAITDGPFFGPFGDCTGNNNYELLVVLLTDLYPNETSWEITERRGQQEVIYSSADEESLVQPFQANTTYNIRRCLDSDEDYVLTVKDSYGDGLCCGAHYEVWIDGESYESDGQFQFSESLALPGMTPIIPQYEDGDFQGCDNNQNLQFEALIQTDMYPNETLWNITDGNGNEVFSSTNRDSISIFEPESLYIIRRCLPDNEDYFFHIHDTYGDGLCCGAYYQVTVDDRDPFIPESPEQDFTFEQVVSLQDLEIVPPDTLDGSFNGCDNNDDYEVLVVLRTDQYPTETTWEITETDVTEVVFSSSDPESIHPFEEINTEYQIRRCLPNDQDYIFTIHDSYGDGLIEEAFYTIEVDGVEFDPEIKFNVSQSISIPTLEIVYPHNYTDGSFEDCGNSDHLMLLTIHTDDFPRETSWELRDSGTGQVVMASPDSGVTEITQPNSVYEFKRCISQNNDYTLTVFDSFGDGLLGSRAFYSVELVDEETLPLTEFASDGDFTYSESVSIPQFVVDVPVILDGAFVDCRGDRTLELLVTLVTDDYPTEISWEITDAGTDEVIYSSADSDAISPQHAHSKIEIRRCLPTNDEYVFTIKDAFGDGLLDPGFYEIALHNDEYFGAGEYGYSESVAIPSLEVIEPSREDGSWVNCDTADDDYQFYLMLTTDSYGYETSWNITDKETGHGVFSSADAGAIGEFDPNVVYEIRRCLPRDRDYVFTINDSFGDGICCGTLDVDTYDYEITYDGTGGEINVVRDGNFKFFESIDLQTGEMTGPGSCDSLHEFQLDLHTDGDAGETSWTLQDLSTPDDEIVATVDTYPRNLNYYQEVVCLETDGPFLFTISDSDGNGLGATGAYQISMDMNVVGAGQSFGNEEQVLFGDFPTANQFEDACDNYGGLPFVLSLLTDRKPQETSWRIVDSNMMIVADHKATYTAEERDYMEYRCLSPLNNQEQYYDFIINDEALDGICCSETFGNGEYSLRIGAVDFFTSLGEFGQSETIRYPF